MTKQNTPTTVMAINPGHNGSTAVVRDGKLLYYVEEERLSRLKRDGNPFLGMLYGLQNFEITDLVIGGTHSEYDRLPWTGENSYQAIARKHYPQIKIHSMGNDHHAGHAAGAYYNSGFDDAISLVVDGSGSRKYLSEELFGFEAETIFYFQDGKPEMLYTSLGENNAPNFKRMLPNSEIEFIINDRPTLTKAYEAVTDFLGFHFIEAGKTMGLAPYGKENEDLPDLIVNGRANRNIFKGAYPRGAFLDLTEIHPFEDKGCGEIVPEEKQKDLRAWHNNENLMRPHYADLAYAIQTQTQQAVGDLIEYAIDRTGCTKICLSGGYGLNCVANYYLRKRFPEIDLFVDPISHDGGTSVGLAKLLYSKLQEDVEIEPLSTLYLGFDHDHASDLEELDLEGATVTESTSKEVAELIRQGNIVTILQGRCEAGPRALGNRSILFDPTVEDGKAFVNKVKGREWFRPFAGTVLAEDAHEWFDLAGMEESPYMMYAVDVKEGKESLIPSITHVDNTCRVQTVTKEQNEHYYELISEFKALSDVPILFNTSFNLAGDPLVETVEDALHTLKHSRLEYLWLPELGKLVYVENTDEILSIGDDEDESLTEVHDDTSSNDSNEEE